MLYEIWTEKSLFSEQDLSSMKIPKHIVDGPVGSLIEFLGINLTYVVEEYQDINRLEHQNYKPTGTDDAIKLYLLMEVVKSHPVSAPLYGRGKKFYGDLVVPLATQHISGEEFETTLGETKEERIEAGLSFPSYNLPAPERAKKWALQDRMRIISELDK